MSRLPSAASATPNCPSPRIEVAHDVCGPLGFVVIDRTVCGIASGGGRQAPDGSVDELVDLALSMTGKRALLGLRPKVNGPIRAEAARRRDEMTLGMTILDLISVGRHDETAAEGATTR